LGELILADNAYVDLFDRALASPDQGRYER
jgi:hypothetical protein